jgi:signal-transduction protein with cAMP-binding, CBS, and nucleotidyltransferase domain
MSQKKVGALVVLSGDCLEGIVSERDYARKVILKGRNSQHTAVREIMTTEVLFVTSQRNIGECMRLMTSRRVRHLPVVEDGKVVGVISMGDIVNLIIGCQEQTINHLQSYIAGSYPA